ncbi:MAG: helix-turn-helix transcriptional regulator [Thermoplasmata archaeon]|nr:helix-turn-helix transcriptional regulator [Thermoplasmata archaeon]
MEPRSTTAKAPPVARPSTAGASGPTGCKVSELFVVLGRPHMLQVLHAFKQSAGAPLRFGELQDQLGISPKTLASRLRTLVEGGFLARRSFNEIPPRVEYQPTPKTQELMELFRSLDAWAERNTVHEVRMVSVVGRLPA